jgi:c-di-GMP-binding flagellar brake protein YcgR
MSESEVQRRHLTRIPFDVEYRFTDDNKDVMQSGKVIDLSLKGALIERPKNLSVNIGQSLILDLLLTNDEVRIQMQVRVSHLHPNSIGVVCEHIDLESMTHLCRMFELNLGSHSMLERELSEMLKLNTH